MPLYVLLLLIRKIKILKCKIHKTEKYSIMMLNNKNNKLLELQLFSYVKDVFNH